MEQPTDSLNGMFVTESLHLASAFSTNFKRTGRPFRFRFGALCVGSMASECHVTSSQMPNAQVKLFIFISRFISILSIFIQFETNQY